jgi:two-component system cell cycle sensor histidine kinase/response regulator CckA
MKRNVLGLTEWKHRKDIELLEQILENAQVGIVIADRDIIIERINPEFTRIFGYTEEEAIGKYIPDLIVPEISFDQSEEANSRLEKGEQIEYETMRRTKDGRIIPVLCRASPIMIDGKKLGGFSFYTDISKRKKAQDELKKAHDELEKRVEDRTRELRESEAIYRSLVDNIELSINLIDSDFNIVMTNPGSAKRRDKDLSELIGRKCYKEIEDKDTVCAHCPGVEAMASGKRQVVEKLHTDHDGTKEYIKIHAFPVIGQNGKAKGFIEVAENITEAKKGEEERKELEAKLQQARRLEAIGTLAGGVAHDLNNILSGIVSYPALLLMDLPQDSPLREPILTIQESGKKAAAIVQDLLTLARRGVSAAEVVNVNQLVSEYLKSPEYEKLKIYHPHVTTETRFEKELLDIMGSPIHLVKTIMNLVSNAAEAMPQGGKMTISTENLYIDSPIKHKGLDAGEYVVLTVSDTGTGISPDDMERIYEPFFTKNVMGRNGTGLGMAIVWGTVEDHDGHIDVQSQIDKGTTFTLYFPATREKAEKDRSELSVEDYIGHGESILVVDDAEEQREIASRILERLGYSATSVPSGEEAVAYLQDHSVDLIILDMIMAPGMDGLETYQRILESHPGQKAIIASGFSETDRVKETLKLGAGAYIKKPYLLERIGVAVREELDRL